MTEAELNEHLNALAGELRELAAAVGDSATARRLNEIADETLALIHVAGSD